MARESTAVCACRKLPMPRGLRHGAERKKSGGFLLGRLRGFHARLTCTVYRAFDTVHFPGGMVDVVLVAAAAIGKL